jgi:hypothetical protein
MANLLEAYKNRLQISESVYSKQHNGARMDQHKKLVVAKCLENVNKYMNEAFDNSIGTQRADLGAFKKFALNLVTVAVPNLIANDLVIVHPMTSMSGYINYLNYTAGSNKGNVKIGDVFNNPFALEQAHNKDANYTSSKVAIDNAAFTAGTKMTLRWSPVQKGSILVALKATENAAPSGYVFDKADGTVYFSTKAPVTTQVTDANGNVTIVREAEGETALTVTTDYVIDYGKTRDGAAAGIGNANATDVFGSITINSTVTGASTATVVDLSYVYNNVYIPQNDLPLLDVKMEAIPLVAKARRIAIYYSQMAAFQAKTDYGFDLGDALAEQAVGQLAYEIDTEVVNLLAETAGTPQTNLTWSKTLPVGVSKTEHYEGFTEIVGIANQIIYDRTKRFAANYMIVASDILPILQFIKGFVAAPAGQINGPYFAGTLNAVKVFVSPALNPGEFVVGVNGSDLMSSAAVYAPYMPIVPTQLLQYADGGTSQGFSTLYDLKVLNSNLVVKGKVVA